MFYLSRSILSVLRLAYWCGEYGVMDRCADQLGGYWLSLQGKQDYQIVSDVSLLGWEPVRSQVIHADYDTGDE